MLTSAFLRIIYNSSISILYHSLEKFEHYRTIQTTQTIELFDKKASARRHFGKVSEAKTNSWCLTIDKKIYIF